MQIKITKKKPLRMANNIFLVFFLLCTPSVFTLQCYENQKSAPTNCQEKNNEVVQGIADVSFPNILGCVFSFISSVRSSYSHPDLLLIHHPPHFFRSHRSSTLDFHFLSHCSYIKGNHWTHLLATCIPYVQGSAR